MKETFSTKWRNTLIEVSADWTNPADPIDGLTDHIVADFSGNGTEALRAALQDLAEADGLSLDDMQTKDLIDKAMAQSQPLTLLAEEGGDVVIESEGTPAPGLVDALDDADPDWRDLPDDALRALIDKIRAG